MGLQQPYDLTPSDLTIVRLAAGRRPEVEDLRDAYAVEHRAVAKAVQRWGVSTGKRRELTFGLGSGLPRVTQ